MTSLSITLGAHCSPQTSYNNASGYHSRLLVFNKHLPYPWWAISGPDNNNSRAQRVHLQPERKAEMEESVEISFSAETR